MDNLTKIYAIFNKKNRQFSAWILDISTIPDDVLKTLLYREVILEQYDITNGMFDPDRYRWVGDYDQGRLQDVLIDNVAIVTEKQVIQKYAEIFLRKYTLNDMWDVITTSEMNTPLGLEMKSFLKNMLTRMESDIVFYRTSGVHDYITTEEFVEKQANAFEVND